MVKCLSMEDMFDFLDGRMEGKKITQIERHMQDCPSCSARFEELLETEHTISTLFPPVSVEATFTDQVMDKLTKKKTTKKHHWRATLATVMITAAFIFLIFSILQKEDYQNASSVSIKVKDVKISDAFIYVTLATSGYDGEHLLLNDPDDYDTSMVFSNGENRLSGFITEKSKSEVTFEFPLFDVPDSRFNLLFDINRLYGIDGKWSIQVPIDRRDMLAQTENVTLQTSFEKDGIDVNFIRAQHGPENSLIQFETKFTEEMATFVEQQVTKYTVDLPQDEKSAFVGYNAQILFDVFNAEGQKLSRSIPEDTISVQNDRYAHTITLSGYPSVQNGGYLLVTGVKFELPTNIRHPLSIDQLPYTFTYNGTDYEVKLLPDQRLEVSSDAKTTSIKNWHITVDHKTAWDYSEFRTENQKLYTTFTLEKDIPFESFILYGQTELKYVYFDKPITVDIH